MRKSLNAILTFGLFLGLLSFARAQNQPPTDRSDSSAIKAGTKISAQLESSLDAKTARPGDEVAARVTKNVKQDGRVVVRKGDRLVGRVTEVNSGAEANGGSSLAVNFDRLVRGSEATDLSTVVSAILSGPEMSPENDNGELAGPMTTPPPAPIRPNSGGVLGGATSTVGGTATGAGGILGSTVNGAASGAVGSATGAVISTPIHAIRISSGTNAQGGTQSKSVFSTPKGDLRLESGTRMEFRVATSEQATTK